MAVQTDSWQSGCYHLSCVCQTTSIYFFEVNKAEYLARLAHRENLTRFLLFFVQLARSPRSRVDFCWLSPSRPPIRLIGQPKLSQGVCERLNQWCVCCDYIKQI